MITFPERQPGPTTSHLTLVCRRNMPSTSGPYTPMGPNQVTLTTTSITIKSIFAFAFTITFK